MNTVCVSGRLARDVDVNVTPNGKMCVRFSIAVQGRNKDDVQWIDCESWNQTAEYLQKYSQKGSLILIEGSLKVDKWEDRNGNKRSTVRVLSNRVSIATGYRTEAQVSDNTTNIESVSVEGISDEDLPF